MEIQTKRTIRRVRYHLLHWWWQLYFFFFFLDRANSLMRQWILPGLIALHDFFCEFLPCLKFLFLLLVYIPHYNVSNDTSLITSTIFAGLFNLLQEAKNITICPRHRDVYGTRWMSGKKRCSIPKRFSGHNTKLPPKGDRGVSFAQAKALYQELGIVIAIGMRKYRSPKEQNICRNYNSVIDSFFIIV